MSDEEKALRRTICAEPGEDTHCLVYADWCDENGLPERAEFIRLQVGLWARDTSYYISFDNCRMCQNSAVPDVRRSADLVHAAWGADLLMLGYPHLMMGDWRFRRGFPYRIVCRLDEFTDDFARRVFGRYPVIDVRLSDCEPAPHEIYDLAFTHPTLLATHARWFVERGYDTFGFRRIRSNYMLPGHLFTRLPAANLIEADVAIRATYRTDKHAQIALSCACVDYGRHQAGLEPVEWPLP